MLSLLWRAAATKLKEFAEVEVPSVDLEEMGRMLVNDDPGSLSFYPASLIQISTRGWIHNHAPLAETKSIPGMTGENYKRIKFFRFYFDGLIVHMSAHESDHGETASYGPNIVGARNELAVPTIPFEHSFQRMNLIQISATHDWPKGGPLLKPNQS
jgi:hypothetical protein